MSLTWARFLSELEDLREQEAILQFECRGAFLTFRSRLTEIERPSAFSVETMNRFGVVPHHVTLTFANGVRINLYMKHVEELQRRGGGVVISFRGDGQSRYSIAFFSDVQRRRFTG